MGTRPELILYVPGGAWGLPSISPFCVKLETWLRMAEIPYRRQPASPMQAPKGKMPYVDLGKEGGRMGDSQLILEHLKVSHAVSLDDHLSPAEAAVGHAVRRMLEEGTYWGLVHERWLTTEGWTAYRPVFGGLMPAAVRWVAVPMVRSTVRKQLHAQGTGRHSPDEIAQIVAGDLDAVAGVLGERPFLLGERPSSVDASVYAMLVSVLDFPVALAGKQHLLRQTRLVDYVERIRVRWWAAPPTSP